MLTQVAFGQRIEGYIRNAGSGGPLQNALIVNNNSGATVYSDSSGYYNIQASEEDRLSFSYPGYHTFYASGKAVAKREVIKLRREDVELKEVEILSDMAKFKRDSALNHTLYRKELMAAKSKAKRKLLVQTAGIGVSYDGLLSEHMMRLSGKKKKYKKFATTLEENERQAFIRIRYNAALVSSITGLKEERSIAFIVCHPMPYDFARQATELELKSWVKDQYKLSLTTGEECIAQ